MSGQPWTEAELAILKQDTEAGVLRKLTARKLPNRSMDAIRDKVSTLGWLLDRTGPHRRVWSDPQLEERKALVLRLGVRTAADQLGMQPATLRMGLWRAGVTMQTLQADTLAA